MAQQATFIDNDARALRAAEINPEASFVNGMNNASCQPGVGISGDNPDLIGTPEQFTLLDQDGAARTPQLGQSIGGVAFEDGDDGVATQAIDLVDPADDSGDGTVTVDGTGATLTTLAAGWVPGI